MEDLKKLINTLNKVCDKDGLAQERLDKAFNLWYPSLEAGLNSLRDPETAPTPSDDSAPALQTRRDQEILEEILDLSRNNQKLLRSPEVAIGPSVEQLKTLIERTVVEGEMRRVESDMARRGRRLNPIALEEISLFSKSFQEPSFGLQILLGLLREDSPWIYDIGIETIKILRTSRDQDKKRLAFEKFERVLDFSMNHPAMRDLYNSRDIRTLLKEVRRGLYELEVL